MKDPAPLALAKQPPSRLEGLSKKYLRVKAMCGTKNKQDIRMILLFFCRAQSSIFKKKMLEQLNKEIEDS